MRKGNVYVFILLVILTSIAFWYLSTKKKTLTKYVGGIQINEANQVEWAKKLKQSGMNIAQVTAYAKQGSWNTDHLWWEKDDTTNVIKEVRAIKSQGINVIMVLRVALQHEYEGNKFKWHGMILPKTKAQKKEWFYRYKHWVKMWAKICDREKVDILAIGSEMNALFATTQLDSLSPVLDYFYNKKKQENHEFKILKYEDQIIAKRLKEYGENIDTNLKNYIQKQINSNVAWAQEVTHSKNFIKINKDREYLDSNWRDIIKTSKAYFKGETTLAANFDNYNEINFWDDLDIIGVNAYFKLRNITSNNIADTTLYRQLTLGWEHVFNEFDTFKVHQNIIEKPIFFTEIGYTQKQECTTAPWKGFGYSLLSNQDFDTLIIWDQSPNKPRERVMAIDALYTVTNSKKIPLIGVSYWKLTTHSYHKGYEPFQLYINDSNSDPLQHSLSKFIQ